MHSKSSIDDLGGQAAVAGAMPRTDTTKFSPGRWSSDQLRPPLFYPSSSQSKAATEQQSSPSTPSHQQSHSETQETYRSGTLYAPRPNRPSSSSSLPLPSQTPFSALPAFGESHDTNHGHGHTHNHGALPQVTENVQSNYDFTTSHGSSYDLTRLDTSENSSSSSSSPTSYHQLTASSLAQHTFPSSIPTLSTNSSSRNSSASSSLPPPTPPTVHTPPLPDADALSGRRSSNGCGTWAKFGSSAPYLPFLSHAPPPKDSYISVETMDGEYRLIVRLPGFKRDCM